MDSQIIIPFLLTLIAGLSTVAGGLIFLSQKFCKKRYLGFFLGLSAGVMICLSFLELLASAVKEVGFLSANLYFFIGILFLALLDFLIPHNYLEEKIGNKTKVHDPKLLSTGVFVALGLVIHNIPEGMAVFLSSFSDLKLGILMALAITLHNIPEGIAVAIPIYHATLSKSKAIKYAFISGIAEPVGAIIAYFFLKPYLTEQILAFVFAMVAGVMVYISFDELLPASFKNGNAHLSIMGLILGMFLASISIIML